MNTKRLDSLNLEKKIKFLKIDAEGFEPEVLQGAKQLFNKLNLYQLIMEKKRGTTRINFS